MMDVYKNGFVIPSYRQYKRYSIVCQEVLDSLMVVCYFSLYCTIFSFLFLSCIPKASVIIYIAYKRGKFRGGNGYDSRAPFNYARTEYL